jgi:predicted methyltransferase
MPKKSRKIPPILTSDTANMILQGEKTVSLDLGLTKTSFSVHSNEVKFLTGENIGFESLKEISQIGDTAFFINKNQLVKLAVFGNRYFKLLPTKGAPTLEIDGIRMHRTKNTTPEKDAKDKINVLGINHGIVLDTCMGLGYTAIEALNSGATKIITIELEPYVIRISKMNPWSQKLFNEPEICDKDL